MSLRLHDTATRGTRDFVPLEPGRASIYVCGATVQSAPDIGQQGLGDVQGFEIQGVPDAGDLGVRGLGEADGLQGPFDGLASEKASMSQSELLWVRGFL